MASGFAPARPRVDAHWYQSGAAAASGAVVDKWSQSTKSVAGWHDDEHAWAESAEAGAQLTTPWPESGEGSYDGRFWAVPATAQSSAYAAVTEYSSHFLVSSTPSSAAGRPSCDIRVVTTSVSSRWEGESVSSQWEVQTNWSENPSPWGDWRLGYAKAPAATADSPFGQGRWKDGKTRTGVERKLRSKYARQVQYLSVMALRDADGRPEHFDIHEWADQHVTEAAYKDHRATARQSGIHVAEKPMEKSFIDRVRFALIDMWVECSKEWRRVFDCPHNEILTKWQEGKERSSVPIQELDSIMFDNKARKRFQVICMSEEDINSPNMRHRIHRLAAVDAGEESGSELDASDEVEKEPRVEDGSVATVVTPMYGSDVDASTVAEKEPLARAEAGVGITLVPTPTPPADVPLAFGVEIDPADFAEPELAVPYAVAFVKPADAEEASGHPSLADFSSAALEDSGTPAAPDTALRVLSQMEDVDASTVAEKKSIAWAIEVNNIWQLRTPPRPVCNAAPLGPVDSLVRECEKTKTERMCHQEDAMIRDLRNEVLSCRFVSSILPFGSRATGLGLPDSDYDMHIHVCGKKTGTVEAMALMESHLSKMENTKVVPKTKKWTLEVLHQGLWFDLRFDVDPGEWDDNVKIARRLKEEGSKLQEYERHAVRLLIDILKSKVEGTTIKPEETVVWDKVKCGSYGGQLKGVMIAHMCFAAFAALRRGTDNDIQDWRRCLKNRASEVAALDYLVAFIVHMPFEQLVLDPFGVNGNVLRQRKVNACTPAYCLDPLGNNVLRKVSSEQLARLQNVCESVWQVLRRPRDAAALFSGLEKCRDEQWDKMFKCEQGKVARAESAAAVVAPMPSSGVDASDYVEKEPRAAVVTPADAAIQVGQQPPPLIVRGSPGETSGGFSGRSPGGYPDGSPGRYPRVSPRGPGGSPRGSPGESSPRRRSQGVPLL